MKYIHMIRVCYLIIFSFKLNNLHSQQAYQVLYEMRGTAKNTLGSFINQHVPDLTAVITDCIGRVKGIPAANVKLTRRIITKEEKISNPNDFYILLAFEGFANYKNDILLHISFYDKTKSEWVQTNSLYLKWNPEQQDLFYSSTKELIQGQFLSDLQYFMTVHQSKPKKTLSIAPTINADQCKDAMSHPMYSKLIFKCPKDITENIKLLGKKDFLFKIAQTDCFQIIFQKEDDSIDKSSVNFDIDGPIKADKKIIIKIDDFYEMWQNRSDKKFDALCTKIFNNLKFQECH